MPIKVDLLLIDPQIDFCDPQKGALYVKNAEKDMENVSKFIDRVGKQLNDIHVTLDTHHYLDIAHPVFWKNSSGEHPKPFTIITKDDITNGNWNTTILSLQKKAEEYLKSLNGNGRYPLCVWPPHCLIGSEGHSIVQPLYNSLIQWERENIAIVDYITKGTNPFTEHYSAVKADVPDPDDPTTQINTGLIQTLADVDIVVIAGEALSHCVANTVLDLFTEAQDDSYAKKFVILEDASSPVVGFEKLGDDFMQEMVQKGVQISNTQDFLK